ncbi:MAG TPA: hypothetical protein PK694_10715, partial [Rhodospirillales bacterium]|nr:hypothetical protein [Rhodospirillales bacterium]
RRRPTISEASQGGALPHPACGSQSIPPSPHRSSGGRFAAFAGGGGRPRAVSKHFQQAAGNKNREGARTVSFTKYPYWRK